MNSAITFTTRNAQALMVFLSKPKFFRRVVVVLKVLIVLNIILLSLMYSRYFLFEQATANVIEMNKEAVIKLVSTGPQTELFMQNLRASGHDPVSRAIVKRKPFTVQGRLVTLDGDNIQVFEYPDYIIANDEATMLASKYITSSRSMAWKKNMHVYVNDKVVVFYMGNKKGIIASLEKDGGLALMQQKPVPLVASKGDR